MRLPPELESSGGIEKWAGRYPKRYLGPDAEIQEMVSAALNRETNGCRVGHLRMDELLEITEWKHSGRRNHPDVKRNSETEVEERSHAAFVDEDYRHLSDQPPKGLRGVGVPTASAIMHFALPRNYPIIDENALLSLGIKKPSYYSHELWCEYQEKCLRWKDEYEIDSLRTLDRALWTYGDHLKKQEQRRLECASRKFA